jgi:flavin-dependent dehydrogenase
LSQENNQLTILSIKVLESKTTDILIIGGGLAGLTAAIHLSRGGAEVTLLDKNEYPGHKVCGEYLSNEVLPYLQSLDTDPLKIGAKIISRLLLSTATGKTTETKLPSGGMGIGRYALDYFLFQQAEHNGCLVIKDTVTGINFENENFKVTTKEGKEFFAKIVIGAYGKRSNIDVNLHRQFIKNKSPFIAVKNHYQGDFPDDLVALHNFKGGYCGISKIETGHINVCYLANYQTFQQYKNIEHYQQEVLCKNKLLRVFFENSTPVFEQPLTISQVSFSNKTAVENHIIMCGDAAGMIHPLCGNGMAMAIHSAKIAAELVLDYFNKKITSRQELEITYSKKWNTVFKKRIATGRVIQTFFGKDSLAQIMMYGLTRIPGILPAIIRQTHGKSF